MSLRLTKGILKQHIDMVLFDRWFLLLDVLFIIPHVHVRAGLCDRYWCPLCMYVHMYVCIYIYMGLPKKVLMAC